MKRITVSLPDELVDKLRSSVSEGQVSSYVAEALTDYTERESLDEILASWQEETPVPESVRREVAAQLDDVGMVTSRRKRRRIAG